MKTKKKISKRMYVIVRNDLASIYKCVQGGHALAKFIMEHPKEAKEWNNEYLIYLGVPNLQALKKLYYKTVTKRVVSAFIEPDLDGQLTSIAIYDTGKIFKKLPLA